MEDATKTEILKSERLGIFVGFIFDKLVLYSLRLCSELFQFANLYEKDVLRLNFVLVYCDF